MKVKEFKEVLEKLPEDYELSFYVGIHNKQSADKSGKSRERLTLHKMSTKGIEVYRYGEEAEIVFYEKINEETGKTEYIWKSDY